MPLCHPTTFSLFVLFFATPQLFLSVLFFATPQDEQTSMERTLSGQGLRRGTNNRDSKQAPTVSRKDRKAREGWQMGTEKEDRKQAHQEHRAATFSKEGRRASWHKGSSATKQRQQPRRTVTEDRLKEKLGGTGTWRKNRDQTPKADIERKYRLQKRQVSRHDERVGRAKMQTSATMALRPRMWSRCRRALDHIEQNHMNKGK